MGVRFHDTVSLGRKKKTSRCVVDVSPSVASHSLTTTKQTERISTPTLERDLFVFFFFARRMSLLVGHTAPRFLMVRYPTIFSRVNDILINWRLLALSLHLMALVVIGNAKPQLIVASALPDPYTQDDFDAVDRSTQLALACSLGSLFICSMGFFTGRTTTNEPLNVVHASCHTIAGVMLVVVWDWSAHVARVWHIWYFFGLLPSVLEIVVFLSSRSRGLFRWS